MKYLLIIYLNSSLIDLHIIYLKFSLKDLHIIYLNFSLKDLLIIYLNSSLKALLIIYLKFPLKDLLAFASMQASRIPTSYWWNTVVTIWAFLVISIVNRKSKNLHFSLCELISGRHPHSPHQIFPCLLFICNHYSMIWCYYCCSCQSSISPTKSNLFFFLKLKLCNICWWFDVESISNSFSD